MSPTSWRVSDVMACSCSIPDDEQIGRAATVLNAGRKIAILAGRGALDARNEVLAVAERLGAPVIKPLLGKGVIPDDSPFSAGGIGLLGTRPAQEALEECDSLLIALDVGRLRSYAGPWPCHEPTPEAAKRLRAAVRRSRNK